MTTTMQRRAKPKVAGELLIAEPDWSSERTERNIRSWRLLEARNGAGVLVLCPRPAANRPVRLRRPRDGKCTRPVRRARRLIEKRTLQRPHYTAVRLSPRYHDRRGFLVYLLITSLRSWTTQIVPIRWPTVITLGDRLITFTKLIGFTLVFFYFHINFEHYKCKYNNNLFVYPLSACHFVHTRPNTSINSYFASVLSIML